MQGGDAMSKADVTRFVADVKSNTQLQNDLINKLGISDIIEVASQHGYQMTDQEVREYAAEQKAQLSEKQLEAVAGGGGYAAAATYVVAKEFVMAPPPPPPPPLIQNLVGIILL
jgi:predicted ribosomally synthesized peptide with nif11-like leader